LGFAEVVGKVQYLDEVRGDRNGTGDANLTFFQRLKSNGVGLEIEAIRSQRRCFGGTASGVSQHVAKRLHLARKLFRSS
jgi:hypothetical protein